MMNEPLDPYRRQPPHRARPTRTVPTMLDQPDAANAADATADHLYPHEVAQTQTPATTPSPRELAQRLGVPTAPATPQPPTPQPNGRHAVDAHPDARWVAELDATSLRIDPRVQRDAPPRSAVARLARTWRREATGVLVASLRPDGGFYVLDGQTRVAAACLVDPTFRFMVEVHEGLSLAQEIDLFEWHNKHRREVTAIEMLKLRITRGHAPYDLVGEALAARGLSLSRGQGGATRIVAAEPIEWLLRNAGPNPATALALGLDVIMEAFPNEDTRWTSIFMQGVFRALLWADATTFDRARLVRALQLNLPRHWVQRARDMRRVDSPGPETWTLVARLVVEQYNKRLAEKRRIPAPWKTAEREESGA